MKLYKNVIAALTLFVVASSFVGVSAKIVCVPKLYAFGFSASFNDSIVYFTDIQEIDSAWINDKTDFLVSRDNYSYQLKNYFTNIGQEHRTCVISFALKRKDIEKKYKKMKEKYVKAGNFSIKTLGKNDFQFTTIKPDDYELENFK
jgi:hypothetical protein